MVWFICQCGESLKKPKVAQHLYGCGSPSISCVDCGKTFYGTEYEAHTSCMSEAQKYQGKLFQGDNNSNKGQVKQDNFTEQLASCVDVAPASLKHHFTQLLSFSNVPRKPKPFKNFAKNSLKLWNDKVLDEMWEIIEKVTRKPPKEEPKAAAAKAAEAKDSEAARKRPQTNEDGEGAKKPKMNGSNGDSFDWAAAVEAVLVEAPKQKMKWTDLQEAVVQQFLQTQDAPKGNGRDLLNLQALAAVPMDYVSTEDAFVRRKAA